MALCRPTFPRPIPELLGTSNTTSFCCGDRKLARRDTTVIRRNHTGQTQGLFVRVVHFDDQLGKNSILKYAARKHDRQVMPLSANTRDAVRQTAMESHGHDAGFHAPFTIGQQSGKKRPPVELTRLTFRQWKIIPTTRVAV